MEIGDRVYHPDLNKNGIVRAIREDRYQCRIGIELFTTNEMEETPHNLGGILSENKGLWVNECKLIATPKPEMENKVTIFGGRGLQHRIRLISELPRRFNRDGSDIIVNYGVVKHRIAPRVFCLNRDIRKGSKYTHLQIFQRAGVPVPEFSREHREGFIQKPMFSFGGRGIVEGDDIDFNNTNTYFQQKIRKIREFRVHVLLWSDTGVPIIQEKTPGNPEDLCWNRHCNGKFSNKYSQLLGGDQLEDNELKDRLTEIGVKCAKALEYDFGGVDILMDEEGELYVVEINARCGLRERTLAEYKQWLWKLGELDIREYVERRFV